MTSDPNSRPPRHVLYYKCGVTGGSACYFVPSTGRVSAQRAIADNTEFRPRSPRAIAREPGLVPGVDYTLHGTAMRPARQPIYFVPRPGLKVV